MDQNLKYLIAVEELAQDILTVKETKLELANAQNKLREALRGLQKSEDRMSFLVVGDLHIYKRTEECKGLLEEGKHNAIENKLCLDGLRLHAAVRVMVYPAHTLLHVVCF